MNSKINKDVYFSALFVIVALIISGFFLMATYNHPLLGDESGYEILGWNIVSGHGYSLSLSAPYESTALREPIYPLFIALIYKIFGRQHLFIYIGQISIFCLSCILIFKIYKELVELKTAKYSAFLTSVCPTLSSYSVILYSENLFIFLLCLTIYLTVIAKKTGNVKWFIATGVSMGLVVLTKTIMIFSPIFIVVFFFLGRNKKFKLASYTANIVLTIFLFAVTLAPWILRNYRLFDTMNLSSSRAEIILLSRALKTDYSMKKIKTAYVYGFSEYLGSKFFPGAIEKSRDFLLDDDHAAFKMEKNLLGQGYTQKEASSILKKEAIAKIKKHPIKYILQTPFEFFKMMSFMHIPLLNEINIINKFKDINGGFIILSGIKGIYKAIGYFIIFLAIIGIYIKRKEWIQHFIPLALILYINLFHSLLYGYARYSVPLIPFYFMYMVIGIFAISNNFKLRFLKIKGNE